MLQALLFDFDGLIIDTEWPEFLAWQEMYRRYGVELTIETWLPCVGRGQTTRVFDPYNDLVERLGRTLDRVDIEDQCMQRNLELINEQPILPGVKELIAAAKQRDLRLAVVSSSSRSWVAGHLSRLKLLDFFDVLVCGDEVEHAKPYPDLYLLAQEKVGVNASQAIALEDSYNGMLSARSAGLFCVVVPGRLTQYMTFGEVDLRVNSLAELTLDMLEQRLAGGSGERRDPEMV